MSSHLWSFQGLFPCCVHSLHPQEAQLTWTAGGLRKDCSVQGSTAFSCPVWYSEALFPTKMLWRHALDFFYMDLCQSPLSLYFPQSAVSEKPRMKAPVPGCWATGHTGPHIRLWGLLHYSFCPSLWVTRSPKANFSFLLWGRKKNSGTTWNAFLHEEISWERTCALDLKKIGTDFSLWSSGISQSPLRTVCRRTSIMVMLIPTARECHAACLPVTNRLAVIS